jgi:hypothetical protein
MTAAERLEARTDRTEPDGCWPYVGGYAQRSGHVQMWHQGQMVGVHRVAWELAHGPIPEGLCVCHRCDNPPCVNPAHLFLGTVVDNNVDRDRKGRQVALKGELHGNAKLTADQVAAIRVLCDRGMPQLLVARAVGVSQANVSLICRREAWA